MAQGPRACLHSGGRRGVSRHPRLKSISGLNCGLEHGSGATYRSNASELPVFQAQTVASMRTCLPAASGVPSSVAGYFQWRQRESKSPLGLREGAP